MKVPQSSNLHQSESPSVCIHMASQLTAPTVHVMLPSCTQCHCCRYLIRKGGDIRGNLGAWYFAWRLSTISLARFYFGKFKNCLHFLRTGKRSLLGGVVKVHFVCLKAIEACCRFPKLKSWVPSSTNEKKDSSNCCKNSSSASPLSFLRQDSTANEGYLGLP